MNLRTFLAWHPVFTRNELEVALAGEYSGERSTANSRLAYHVCAGHILPIRRGLYAAVPVGHDPATFVPDPWLITAKLAEDAVIAYHSALRFHGRGHSLSDQFLYFSHHAVKPEEHFGCRFRRVPYPQALCRASREQFGVESVDRQGIVVRVATMERLLVDLLDRPDLGGGWEEIWRSLESVEYFDLDLVVKYALLLDNATTVAKVGFFLDLHRDRFMVTEEQLARLRQVCPRQPHYLEPGQTGRLIRAWNLVVPDLILDQAWEERDEDITRTFVERSR